MTVKQIQKLDEIAINHYGFPSLVLMENAGRRVYEEVMKNFRPAVVIVICGQGNNAGDGFVTARHLINAGVKTNIILIGRSADLKQDALVNYRILRQLKHPVRETARLTTRSLTLIREADVVVDAIFGVGLNREITDPYKRIIETINREAKKVVAVDIPSGLDGTNGKIHGVCVKANLTVTFSFPKCGFYQSEGPQKTGKVIVADIGIPDKLKKKIIK
ncbi:MAG: NAD(P)H-hydrate epimerase [Candidatus Omnitrophota bacterium]